MNISLSPDTYRDKVLGCWMGKNSGGTLGAPLEKAFGEAEPFDVWWYPKLEAGGIPNDDLELQLLWLLALEEVGPSLKATDLAQYWLDYVGYNMDEYGFHKTNLRFGLQPPVSSVSNNWFKDCMGCPIRSEIWACIVPGHPRIAVRYAYEDAILDHAGGEGVYGELFNTAIAASAFVLDDPLTLIRIGLSYVPEESDTYAAVQAALDAHAAGEDWKQARQRVLDAVPHYNAQHAPINMGLQIIGWLYGKDYGEAICIAVNCGYDTDCTGATLGSFLGIVLGNNALPAKWLEPLGTAIATNASWGGLRNVDKGIRSLPANTDELTNRTLAVSKRVMSFHGLSLEDIPADVESLVADDACRELWRRNPWRIDHSLQAIDVGIEYPKSASIAHAETKRMVTHLTNPHPCALRVAARLSDRGLALSVSPSEQTTEIGPRSTVELLWDVTASGPLEATHCLDLVLSAEGRPAIPSVPIVLVGAIRWRLLEAFATETGTLSDRELFDTAFAPEALSGSPLAPDARAGEWREADTDSNDLPFARPSESVSATYAQTFTWSPAARKVRIGVPSNVPVKIWLNGNLGTETFVYRPFRPNYGGGCGDGLPTPYIEMEFTQGWNEILLKFVRSDQPLVPATAKMEAALVLTDPDDHLAGLTDQIRSRFPWE